MPIDKPERLSDLLCATEQGLGLKTDELMEISWQYAQGYYNLEEAKQLIHLKIGLDESIAELSERIDSS